MIGLDDSARKLNNSLLQALLASEYVLATKVRKFHWNVKGEEFMMLHEMFGKMYEDINDQADEIAERIRQLDGTPNGTLQEFIDNSFLKEGTLPVASSNMIQDLVDDSDKMVSEMRAAIPKAEANKDFGTMDLITGWMELHEKQLYFLRSHLA